MCDQRLYDNKDRPKRLRIGWILYKIVACAIINPGSMIAISRSEGMSDEEWDRIVKEFEIEIQNEQNKQRE